MTVETIYNDIEKLSASEQANAAKADGAYLPLIVYIPSPDEPVFVGV